MTAESQAVPRSTKPAQEPTMRSQWTPSLTIKDGRTGRYDPWVHLATVEPFKAATVAFSDLGDDKMGLTDFKRRRITINTGMTEGEIRGTLAHELVHLERGPVAPEVQEFEESIVDLVSASRLIPTADLADLRRRLETAHVTDVALAFNVDEYVIFAAAVLSDALHAQNADRAARKAAVATEGSVRSTS